MNAAARTADRAAGVRSAARAWRDAGVVTPEAYAAIVAKYPDDRVRSGLALRILLAVVTFVAAAACVGLLLFAGRNQVTLAFFVVAALCGVVAEVAVSLGNWCGRGPEEAAAAWAVLGAAIAVADPLSSHGDATATGALVACCVVSAVAAWRWGMPFFGLPWAVGLIGAVAYATHGGRLVIVPLALAVTGASWVVARARRFAPAQRRAGAWALGTALVVFGLATNRAVLDDVGGGFARDVVGLAGGAPGPAAAWAATLATALLPVVLLALGVRFRDRLLLWLGAAATAAAFVTLRVYVHGVPLWLVLLGAGAAVIAVAAALMRWIDAGPGRERGGFTVRDLLPEKSREFLVQAATAMATTSATPAGPEKVPASSTFGGGDFGGGGASSGY